MSATEFDTRGGLIDLIGEFADAGLPLNHSSTVLANSIVVCTDYCYLLSFTVLNTNAAAQFIQLHDARTLPANGAVPASAFTVPGSSNLVISYVMPGRKFFSGIVIANSSTSSTLTVGAADCYFDAQFLATAMI